VRYAVPYQAVHETSPEMLFQLMSLSLFLEEYRLGVFENRVLRRIFGPKWDEVTGEWRKIFIFCTYAQILLGRSYQGE